MTKANSASAATSVGTRLARVSAPRTKRFSKQTFEDLLRGHTLAPNGEGPALGTKDISASTTKSVGWQAQPATQGEPPGRAISEREPLEAHLPRGDREGQSQPRDADEASHPRAEPWMVSDPLMRVLATTSPVASAPPPVAPTVDAQTLDAVAQQLVKRLSVGRTASGGAVRVELGAGPYAGTGIVLTNDGSAVHVGLDGDADEDSQQLVSRLVQRLRSRGMDAYER